MRSEYASRISGLDPVEDYREIVYLLTCYEFPWDIERALEFALFRTYAVPSISGLLDRTGEFVRRTRKRYDDTELILAAEVYPADQSDGDTVGPTVSAAQDHLIRAECDADIKEVVLDKGYHSNETLAELEFTEGLRTYVAEPKQTQRRNWKDKPDEQRRAVANNRRRIKGKRGRALQRKRSERVERSFAHVCETGGGRRAWLRGLAKVRKRHLMAALAHNLGLLMRSLFGFGTARSLQAAGGLAVALYFARLAIQAARQLLTAALNHFQPKTKPATKPTHHFAAAA